ncbi:MAG: hypothetical protein MZV63_23330 [Marinilabiliales bacterium]|nr:hypothetical protein [Marinilabiliales bacterium]
MSEAGMPGLADPGNIVAAEAHRRDIKVIPLTGPSSVMLALVASGLNGQSFAFTVTCLWMRPEGREPSGSLREDRQAARHRSSWRRHSGTARCWMIFSPSASRQPGSALLQT